MWLKPVISREGILIPELKLEAIVKEKLYLPRALVRGELKNSNKSTALAK